MGRYVVEIHIKSACPSTVCLYGKRVAYKGAVLVRSLDKVYCIYNWLYVC